MATPLSENLHLALDTLRSHKLRSALTILGVFVGVVTLMAIGSILTGLNQSFTNEMKSFGTNTIFVYKFQPGIHVGRLTPQELNRPPISQHDIDEVESFCSACQAVSPQVFRDVGEYGGTPDQAVRKGHVVASIQFSGAMPNYPVVMNRTLGAGRFFTPIENRHHQMVIVLGTTLAQDLFPRTPDPIGGHINVNGNSFRVIGVFAPQNMAGNDQQDLAAIIPYDSFRKIYANAREHFFAATAKPGELQQAIDEIRIALRRSRHDQWNQPDSFGYATADSIIKQFHDITSEVALIIVVVASIGMLIGGVGVMNIMLVSVTERTREIGVRKAIGARRTDIIQQFLAEAVTLTGLGGLLGIAGGWLISLLINVLLPKLPSSIPLWAMYLGFGAAVSVGLFFGVYPAVKAAKLNPIEALRYE